jgi:hypothetical protein
MKLRINLDGSLNDQLIAKLDRILATIADGWHEWVYPDPAADGFTHYLARNSISKELLEKSFVTSTAYEGLSRSLTVRAVESSPDSATFTDSYMDIAVAVYYLTQPLQIIVENERNDGRFLLAHLNPVAGDLVNSFSSSNPPVTFYQGGGKDEIIGLLRHKLDQARVRNVPPRLFVVVDSDAEHPGHVAGRTRELLELGRKGGVPIKILEKRSIENYFDNDILEAYAAASPDVSADVKFILSMGSVFRDYYPMKKGIIADVKGVPVLSNEVARRFFAPVDFPNNAAPKLPGLAKFFFSQMIDRTIDNLDSRNCKTEINTLADAVRWEL